MDTNVVVVLSCGGLGVEVANRLQDLEHVDAVTLVTAPYRTRTPRGLEKLIWAYRHEGPVGFLAACLRRLRKPAVTGDPRPGRTEDLASGIDHHHVSDFHAPECLGLLESLEPDLGVLAGVYILKEEVFRIPRLGSINLHTGKVPEYRGSAPAFWELYNGETEVGVTVHQVTERLDAGTVIRQRLFPLDPKPEGDPLEYVRRYRREVLVPNGVDLLVASVHDILTGRANPRPQDHREARTYRLPEHKHKKELRRRVRQRRREAP
jgi:methionyl-tRNA formyltransferase